MIDATHFATIYAELVEEIDHVVTEKYYPIIRNMYRDDPRELILADRVFESRNAAAVFVWMLFRDRAKKAGLLTK